MQHRSTAMSLREDQTEFLRRRAADRVAIADAAIHPQVSEMSDSELLRFGVTAKYLCSDMAGLASEQREAFAVRLRQAAEEWSSRFPSLPLSATFYEIEREVCTTDYEAVSIKT